MSNLTLITTETFNNLPCNFYRNIFNELAYKITSQSIQGENQHLQKKLATFISYPYKLSPKT